MRRPGSPAELERRRMTAANMFDQGLGAAVIAASLEVDDQTVRKWRARYDAGGRDALRSRAHPGRAPRLTGAQREALAALLERAPAECGFADRYLWTQQLIADLILRESGVAYHHDHVGVVLAKLGFTHQKPMRRARERDGPAVEAWRRDAWPALLKKARRPAG